MPAKLARLGLSPEQNDCELLDMCCGHGEALDSLHKMGYRKLSGIDLTITKELALDPRFKIRQGDVTSTNLPAASYDWITCIHSMHHLASAANVERLLDESWRLLRPGGRLGIIDFPGSLQIKIAFWFFRQPWLHFTPYHKYFGRIIQEEWHFLKHYLPQWPIVHDKLMYGRFKVERCSNTLFYFYLTLKKPVLSA
jgi:ubiquinone/menaquinone biosynthesis C-methylase UbiE